MTPFVVAAGTLIVLLLALTFYYRKRVRNASGSTWQDLLARLNPVDHSSLKLIALDVVDESGQQRKDSDARQMEAEDIWRLIGGLKGLELLEQNSHVLVEIAAYVQRWYPEALGEAEELRRNARQIGWHVERLRKAYESDNLEGWFANYAQNTIATYYLMTRRVLALCEANNSPMAGDLQRAL